MSKSRSIRDGIGQPVQRREDLRLIQGQGCFSNDISLPDQVHAYFVRSPHAHAKIVSIDPSAALALEGVLAVLTGKDVEADGLKSLPHRPVLGHHADVKLTNSDGTDKFISPHLPLPADRARFVGEAVAVVIADTVAIAKDAAELVAIDYEALPAVTGTVAAAAPDAPRVWDEHANVSLDARIGDAQATDAAFARAVHVTSISTWIQRLTGVPMEPRAALGSYDAQTGRYTLFAGSGNVVRQKRELAHILGIDEPMVRVVARDIGGNFGTRNAFYPEFAVIAWASRRVGRPVHWNCERQEAFLSDYQGRDLYVEAEIALDEDGRFLALRGSNLSNVGAHTVSFVPLTKGIGLMSSVYDIPCASFRGRAVNSNTPSTNSYRSAGRPEAMFVIERLIDMAAREHGFDRVALRRRNLIQPDRFPYANPLGLTYDSGEYPRVMERALELGNWNSFPARRAEARSRGKCRGIGVANYVEITSGMPRERAEVTVQPDGHVDVVIGTLSSGQGHETSFAQLITEWFKVPIEQVRIITGDTDIVQAGGGSQSGRSMRLAGIVIGKASESLLARATRIATHLLGLSDPAAVSFENGRFGGPEGSRRFDIFEIAAAANAPDSSLPDDLRGPLAAVSDETVQVAGYPFGSHVCEVEVDPDTGTVELVDYVAVDDVGQAINPLILHGQAHGGIAQGVGQALLEQCFYEAGSGQLLSGSFMDYAIPRASDLPDFTTEISETLSPTNPLGVRAGGEGGTTPALGVVINAIVDALAEFGVTHVEMPATPERVWKAIRDAREHRKNIEPAGAH
ncbi:xanthine dehydrogenase family protein molybdopterin-binding subunit [Paraburkholderia sp. ZP32-5]|uniref:xanthine dehydrogenase family protein molybdopterin-binding subunit n=1 Tax=Paraburkholderia sp. ZP32-5 TaxID=2883245 RepID=UPI001F35BD04|nr:xanthine dehydrogenase family protein molybdopterin-binding subunit [Paraburkholderia sp. ZP32-5]